MVVTKFFEKVVFFRPDAPRPNHEKNSVPRHHDGVFGGDEYVPGIPHVRLAVFAHHNRFRHNGYAYRRAAGLSDMLSRRLFGLCL